MIYTLHSGKVTHIQAEDHYDLVVQMMDLDRNQYDNIHEYMEEVSRRCFIDSAADINPTTIDGFINDLLTHGYLNEERIQ